MSEDLTGSFSGSRVQVHRFQVPELRSTGFRFQSSGPQVSSSRVQVHSFLKISGSGSGAQAQESEAIAS